VDLGNRRLLSRQDHVSTDGANFTDIEKVFDSDIPQSANVRLNAANELLIPKELSNKFRFKQLDTKGKTQVLAQLDGSLKKLQSDKTLTTELATELIHAD